MGRFQGHAALPLAHPPSISGDAQGAGADSAAPPGVIRNLQGFHPMSRSEPGTCMLSVPWLTCAQPQPDPHCQSPRGAVCE